MDHLPQSMRRLFWDSNVDEIDLERHADSILARVLEFGFFDDVKWLIAHYGLPRIHRFFREVGHPEISERTRHFWRAVLGAEHEEWASPPAWRKSSSSLWIE